MLLCITRTLDALLAEQMTALQEEERRNELIMEQQIESYEREEDCCNNNMDDETLETSGYGHGHGHGHDNVNCPLCHVGVLKVDPSSPGNFYCTNMNINNTGSNNNEATAAMGTYIKNHNCKLGRGASFGNNSTLIDLKQKLMRVYEDHSLSCPGSLQFDIDLEGGNGLAAGCAVCMKIVTVAPAMAIVKR